MKTISHLAPGQRQPIARAMLEQSAREILRAGLTVWELRQVLEGLVLTFERLEHKPEEARRFRDKNIEQVTIDGVPIIVSDENASQDFMMGISSEFKMDKK